MESNAPGNKGQQRSTSTLLSILKIPTGRHQPVREFHRSGSIEPVLVNVWVSEWHRGVGLGVHITHPPITENTETSM